MIKARVLAVRDVARNIRIYEFSALGGTPLPQAQPVVLLGVFLIVQSSTQISHPSADSAGVTLGTYNPEMLHVRPHSTTVTQIGLGHGLQRIAGVP